MAEGRSNAAIAEALVLTVGAVEKHVQSIMSKLDLPPAANDHRRVLAVLAYLRRRTLTAPRAESAPPSGTSSGPRPPGPNWAAMTSYRGPSPPLSPPTLEERARNTRPE